MPYQKISETQTLERRKKGLCYFGDEKWHQEDHNCVRPRLYLMKGMESSGDDASEQDQEQDSQYVETIHEESLEIVANSPHAMVGTLRPQNYACAGNTHNFVDTSVVIEYNLSLSKANPVQVKVANGEVLSTMGRCIAVVIKMQGTTFVTDFFTLALGGYDIVLGVQWFLSLSPILWDLVELIMEFT